MIYKTHYDSPLGDILLSADDKGLTGLWFDGQKYFAVTLSREHEEKMLPVFEETDCWLDIYFQGKEPDFLADGRFDVRYEAKRRRKKRGDQRFPRVSFNRREYVESYGGYGHDLELFL